MYWHSKTIENALCISYHLDIMLSTFQYHGITMTPYQHHSSILIPQQHLGITSAPKPFLLKSYALVMWFPLIPKLWQLTSNHLPKKKSKGKCFSIHFLVELQCRPPVGDIVVQRLNSHNFRMRGR